MEITGLRAKERDFRIVIHISLAENTEPPRVVRRMMSQRSHSRMTEAAAGIRFRAKLLRPVKGARVGSWLFLALPKRASAKLPSRGRTTVEGTINGVPFRALLEPDGEKSHWLKVSAKLRKAAGADVGDVVRLEIAPVGVEPEPRVPADLRKALAADPKARAVWSDITPMARRDWIHWIVSAKRPETRARRIVNGCSMLASGKRRVCCFDRSGFYSRSLASPEAAPGGVSESTRSASAVRRSVRRR
jgi:hypothetical protein